MKRLPRFCSLFITVVLAVALLAGCGNPPADTGSQGNSGGIEGIVTDCGGNPVAGMTALIVSGTAGFPEIAAATDSDGHYGIYGVPAGRFELAVHDGDGYRIKTASVVVRGGETARLNFDICEETPDGIMTVAGLLEAPVYDREVTVIGTVGLLGELLCPCFELTSGGETMQVWYGLMVENDGTERPSFDVGQISNGDRIIVTGELKGEGGAHYSEGDFWIKAVTLP